METLIVLKFLMTYVLSFLCMYYMYDKFCMLGDMLGNKFILFTGCDKRYTYITYFLY